MSRRVDALDWVLASIFGPRKGIGMVLHDRRLFFFVIECRIEWELDEAYEGVKRFIPQDEMVSWLFLYGGFYFYFCSSEARTLKRVSLFVY